MSRLRNLRLFGPRDALRLAVHSPRSAAHAALSVGGRFPRRVGLFLTDRCNFACPMCAVKDVRHAGADMPFECARRVLDECAAHGAVVDLIGGEPLMYGEIIEVVRLAAASRTLAAVTTNGLLLERHAAALVERGLPVLQVSLDGWDEASQALRGRVPGSFERILAGIRAVERLKAGRAFPIVRVLTAITCHNYHSLDRIQDVVASLGLRYWGVTNYFYLSAAAARGVEGPVAAHTLSSDRYLSAGQVTELKRSLARVRARGLGLRMSYAWEVDVDRYYATAPPSPACRCELPYTRLDVHPDGRISVCVGCRTVGCLPDDTLASTWRGEALAGFRRHYERARPLAACFRCCGLSQDIRFSA